MIGRGGYLSTRLIRQTDPSILCMNPHMTCMEKRLRLQESVSPRFSELFPSHLGSSQDSLALSLRLPWETSPEHPATHRLLQLLDGRNSLLTWSHQVPDLHSGPAFDLPPGPKTNVPPPAVPAEAGNAENAALIKKTTPHICNQLGELSKCKRTFWEMEGAQCGQDTFGVPRPHQGTSLDRALELGLDQQAVAPRPNQADVCDADFKISAHSNFYSSCGSKCDCKLCHSERRPVLLANNLPFVIEGGFPSGLPKGSEVSVELQYVVVRDSLAGVCPTETSWESVLKHLDQVTLVDRPTFRKVIPARQLLSSWNSAATMKKLLTKARLPEHPHPDGLIFRTYLRADVTCHGAKGARTLRVYSRELLVCSDRNLRRLRLKHSGSDGHPSALGPGADSWQGGPQKSTGRSDRAKQQQFQ